MEYKLTIPLILSLFLILACIIYPSPISYGAGIYNKTLDHDVGGNILMNPHIAPYLYHDSFNPAMIKDLKRGSKVYRFGNGSGKKILICGGIHGSEVQGSLSALRFLKYLKSQDLRGTIYVIPFAIPYSTQKNTRAYHGYDPNRKADIANTPVNKILLFALAKDVDYLIDVHSGTGVRYNGLVYYQSSFERNWALHINKTIGSSMTTGPTNGTLRTEAHKQSIQSITLEVEKYKFGVIKPTRTEFYMICNAFDYLNILKKDLKVSKVRKKSKYIYITITQKGIPPTQNIALKYLYGKKIKITSLKFYGRKSVTIKRYWPYKKCKIYIDPYNRVREINEINNYYKFSYSN